MSRPLRSTSWRSLVAAVAAAGLAVSVATPTRAEMIADEPAPTAEVAGEPLTDPALTDAQALYGEGLTHYETLDYDLAIDKWKQALGRLRAAATGTPEQAASVAAARNAIVYNIARAQEKAFDQDKDVARLKKAKGLLERYVEDIAAGTSDSEDVAKARARIAELSARIEQAEAKPEPAITTPPEPVRTDAPAKPRGRGLVGGGSALLVAGIGLIAGGASAGSLMTTRAERRVPELDELADEPERRDELARGTRGDVILIACAVSGGVLALGGIAMIAVGATRMRSRAPRAAATPAIGRGFAGVVLRGRF